MKILTIVLKLRHTEFCSQRTFNWFAYTEEETILENQDVCRLSVESDTISQLKQPRQQETVIIPAIFSFKGWLQCVCIQARNDTMETSPLPSAALLQPQPNCETAALESSALSSWIYTQEGRSRTSFPEDLEKSPCL